ncbi:hypothetical protein CR513_36463, partial [Mucuna pruriens]
MGKEPSLSVFFWYFSPRQANKVRWTSLSNQPRRKLMKLFCESYKRFKDHFFRVAASRTESSLLLGYSVKDIASLKVCSRSTTLVVAVKAPPAAGPTEIVAPVVEVVYWTGICGYRSGREVLQRYNNYALIFAKAIKQVFGDLAAHEAATSTKNKKAHEALLKLSSEYADAQTKINNYRDSTANLQVDLDRVVREIKELRLAQQELESS